MVYQSPPKKRSRRLQSSSGVSPEEISGNGVMYASDVPSGGVLGRGGGRRRPRPSTSTPYSPTLVPKILGYGGTTPPRNGGAGANGNCQNFPPSNRIRLSNVEEEDECDNSYNTASTLRSDTSLLDTDDCNLGTEDKRGYEEEVMVSDSTGTDVPMLDDFIGTVCDASAWFTNCFPCAVVDINDKDEDVVERLSKENAMSIMYSPVRGKKGKDEIVKAPHEMPTSEGEFLYQQQDLRERQAMFTNNPGEEVDDVLNVSPSDNRPVSFRKESPLVRSPEEDTTDTVSVSSSTSFKSSPQHFLRKTFSAKSTAARSLKFLGMGKRKK